ncbi:hypothetical protein QL285_015734 [Trifolium repens]|nr:hypothetical protein QL285_015734 [Trifolium repens]
MDSFKSMPSYLRLFICSFFRNMPSSVDAINCHLDTTSAFNRITAVRKFACSIDSLRARLMNSSTRSSKTSEFSIRKSEPSTIISVILLVTDFIEGTMVY